MRPVSIPAYINDYFYNKQDPGKVKQAYERLYKDGRPDVSIVMPAYNEESTIVQTLASLCNNETKWSDRKSVV